jgi:NAD(P)-dependent dehydrogenase (short-subunit alcohol dehydrogenase family)/acyl carrier protein
LWLAGVQVNWSGFYANEQRSRLPLPTYPFERQRYWIDPPSPHNADSKPASGEKKTNIADWFYVPSWKRSILPSVESATARRTWLVFVDRCLGASMVRRLEQQGNDVIQVSIGTEFRRVSDHAYVINPEVREHYDALLQDIALEPPSIIITHLWCVTPNLSSAQSQELGFYSLLYLAQAIGNQGITDPLQIAVVSSNIQNVTGTEVLHPEKATLLGPVKVIPQEYSQLTCRCIDVVMPESGAEDKLIGQLIAEITAKSSDAVVAYRGSYRWLPTFEPVRLEATAQTRLRQGGVYLITGGTGGIGLAIAEYLAETVQAKLALIGRSLPAKSEWETWLQTYDEQDVRVKKIRQLQKIEQLGAEVLVESADVADADQMQAAVTKIQQQFGAIHGVIHAAGVPGDGIVQLKQPETAAEVMAPKVEGTLVLEQIFQACQLDFFVLFSSISAIAGGLGQVDYCAANAFLDVFAQCNANKFGGSTISINWDAWQEVGMGAETTARADTLKQERQKILNQGILPSEGVEALRRILSSSLQQVIVSTQVPTAIAQSHALDRESVFLQSKQTPGLKSTHARPLQATAYVAPRNEIEQQIADIWQELLGIEQIGIHDNFFELGGHSLLAVQTVSRLREFQVELPLQTLLSEATTIAGIANVIASRLPQPKELDEMADVLAEIESLLPQQVKEQLVNEC